MISPTHWRKAQICRIFLEVRNSISEKIFLLEIINFKSTFYIIAFNKNF